MLVAYVTPYFTESARLFLSAIVSRAASSTESARIAVVSAESIAVLPPELRESISAFEQVVDPLSAEQIAAALARIVAECGPVDRILGIAEQLQVQLGELREGLGLPGMGAAQARRFRDKTLMKDALRAAGVPVARHRQVETSEAALGFAEEVGYPLIVKPPAGAAAQSTFRVADDDALRAALGPASIAAGGVVLLEEMVTGEEHSFDAFVKDGRVVFYSTSNYHPSCLEVMEHAWMQWVVVLPREHQAADIAAIGARALQALGLEQGMCHLEWFRRKKDGSVVVSEVGARPPGAQIPTMIARAHDVDVTGAWADLMMFDRFEPFPERRYAVGAAYLRGQGEGRVKAVHGIEQIHRDLGDLVTDARIPTPGWAKGVSYEGEGFIILRHPETSVLEEALRHVVSTVRVELG